MAEKKEKRYVSDDARLMTEWNWNRNNDLKLYPEVLTVGSGKKVWWKCYKGHEWLAEVKSRNKGTGCPICSGKKVLEGFNDLATTHPEIAAEWHPTRNKNLYPTNVVSFSAKKVWWICTYGHEWEATVARRSNGDSCPYCSGHKTLAGFNDLQSNNPDLASEWNVQKNGKLTAQDVTCNSGLKVWWKCKNGHEWESRVSDRNYGHGCPYCSGRKAIADTNDLRTLFPQLIKEWCYEKNTNITPNLVKPNSRKSVWWRCERGHTWKAIIKNRVNGHGCPFCAGVRAFPGENDLMTKYPSLAKEWHANKNTVSSPIGVSCYSNKKVWWRGVCGHEWQDTPGHRVMGRGCPVCNRQNKTSFPEQAIFYYISKKCIDAVNGYSKIFPDAMELDVYIPSLNIAIEYDGEAWHSTEIALEREKRKFFVCQKNGIRLIRVKEAKKETDKLTCDYVIYCDADLNVTIKKLLNYCALDITVDVDKDRLSILEKYLLQRRKNSLASKFPELSSEWHPTRNGSLTPDMFSSGSGEIVWWICSKGHEWQMPINVRSQGNGCPYCSSHRLLKGYNDLRTKCPELAKEWHPTKNFPLMPNDVFSSSRNLVWWKCEHGHEWQSKVADRSRGLGCPYCSNKKVLQGYNDLATTRPEMLEEWDYEKNIDITPETVTSGSSKIVWWVCKQCGHNWQASVYKRKNGRGCPECAKLKRKSPKSAK